MPKTLSRNPRQVEIFEALRHALVPWCDLPYKVKLRGLEGKSKEQICFDLGIRSEALEICLTSSERLEKARSQHSRHALGKRRRLRSSGLLRGVEQRQFPAIFEAVTKLCLYNSDSARALCSFSVYGCDADHRFKVRIPTDLDKLRAITGLLQNLNAPGIVLRCEDPQPNKFSTEKASFLSSAGLAGLSTVHRAARRRDSASYDDVLYFTFAVCRKDGSTQNSSALTFILFTAFALEIWKNASLLTPIPQSELFPSSVVLLDRVALPMQKKPPQSARQTDFEQRNLFATQ